MTLDDLKGSEGLEDPRFASFCSQVAEAIGGEIRPEEVANLIEELRNGKFILHGVKHECLVPSVLNNGVGTQSSSGELIKSSWCTGSSIFGQLGGGFSRDPNKLDTYNSTFFHYVGSYEPNLYGRKMTLALTIKDIMDSLSDGAPSRFEDDSEISAPFHVPRSAVHVLRAELLHLAPGLSHREIGQAGEQAFFRLMQKVIHGGEFRPGGYTEFKD